MTTLAERVRARPHPTRETVLVGAGLLLIYVVWGSVYVAIRYVVQDVPPLLSIGVRYVVAGLLLASYVAARRGTRVLRTSRRALLGCVLLAVLLQVLTNGTTTWAEAAGVQAGPAALLSALAPIGIIMLRLGTGDRPRAVTWLGVVAGFAGLAVLLLGGRSVPGFPLWPSLLVVAAAGCWAVGSFLQPRLDLPVDTFVTAAFQLLVGGALLTLAGLLGGERTSLGFPGETWWVLGYLTLSSVVSYTTYVWLLAHAPISLVSTHAYVNPVVAVVLGWWWLGEPVTWPVVVGGAVVLVAVGLIMAERRRLPEEPPVA
ncbi:EamA family transporter [Nocardioides cynanchi]|uniref:EamA family transporter n=1 Tax=Nocardioides cynanchi TaxID=2558918 RepID=UPI001243D13B|nr:EamA family transporter [Nocardioides cynanchi]